MQPFTMEIVGRPRRTPVALAGAGETCSLHPGRRTVESLAVPRARYHTPIDTSFYTPEGIDRSIGGVHETGAAEPGSPVLMSAALEIR